MEYIGVELECTGNNNRVISESIPLHCQNKTEFFDFLVPTLFYLKLLNFLLNKGSLQIRSILWRIIRCNSHLLRKSIV